jgi:hypothetical protein
LCYSAAPTARRGRHPSNGRAACSARRSWPAGRPESARIAAALRVVRPLRSAQARALEGAWRHQAAAARMVMMGGMTLHLAHWGIRGCQRLTGGARGAGDREPVPLTGNRQPPLRAASSRPHHAAGRTAGRRRSGVLAAVGDVAGQHGPLSFQLADTALHHIADAHDAAEAALHRSAPPTLPSLPSRQYESPRSFRSLRTRRGDSPCPSDVRAVVMPDDTSH